MSDSGVAEEEFSVERALKRLQATADMAVEYGQAANERLGVLERQIAAIRQHVGMNGARLEPDTLPAPPTQPENERPGEV